MQLAKQQASHWYLPDGTPYYEVPRADGSGMRKATLADARKVGAYPSVTTVLEAIAKPGLTRWMIEQGIMSSLTLPRLENEPLDAFARRVADDMDAQREEAADFGSRVHDAIVGFFDGHPASPIVAPFVDPVFEWIRERGLEGRSEQVAVSKDHGYAGRYDFSGLGLLSSRPIVVDFKTQKVKGNGKPKPVFYNTWPLQLAAYAEAIDPDEDWRLTSIIIDSGEPGRMFVKEWEHSKSYYFNIFWAAMQIWRYDHNYNPLKPVEA